MRSVPMIKMAKTVVAVLMLVLLAGVAGMVTGCNDGGEADMYAQISGGNVRATPSSGVERNRNPGGGGTEASAPVEGLPGLPGETPVEDAPADGEEVDRSLTLVPGITIESIDVKTPYPEFTGEGRYNVKVSLVTESPVPGQVFMIMAIGEDGEVVGTQERDLRLPRKKPGTFHFDDWYCMAIPVTVEFHTTDTQSATADGSTGNVDEGRGGSASAGLN